MKNFKRIIKKLIIKGLNLIKSKEMILMESHSDFCDNTKALFDEMIRQKINDNYKIIWFVDNPDEFKKYNYKNVKFVSINGFSKRYYFLKAKYCFYSHRPLGNKDVNNQVRFFLTHAAVPIKDSRGSFGDPHFHTNILSTSKFASVLRCKSFMGGEDLVNILGFPRNDLLFNEIDIVKKGLVDKKFNKVLLWMPTFKHYKTGEGSYKGTDNKDFSLLNKKFMTNLNKRLKEKNVLLIIKFHPGQDLKFVDFHTLSNILTITNAELFEKKIDLYSLIGSADSLITDFSSVYFDYLLVNKPIAFELVDMGKYKDKKGFLIDNPLDYMPGHHICNEKDFYDYVDDIIEEKDIYEKERLKLTKKVHKYIDNKSSERIIEFLNLNNKK